MARRRPPGPSGPGRPGGAGKSGPGRGDARKGPGGQGPASRSGPAKGAPGKGGPAKGAPGKGGPAKGAPGKGPAGPTAARKGRGQQTDRQDRAGRTGSPGRSAGRRTSPPKGLGGDQVEGRQAVRELLLANNRRVREIYVIDDMDQADVIDDIVELAGEAAVAVKAVSRRHFDTEALTDSHQGVLARAEAVAETDLDVLANRAGAFLLVLDGITDPGNLGAILRTAECAGVTGIVMPRHRSVHLSPTVTKTAAGAIEYLPMALVGGIPTALTRLREMGVFTVGLEAGSDTSVFNLPVDATTKVALVLGAEGDGLSRLVRERVETLASIPLAGRLNSLNVAMAGAAACFEIVRQRQTHDRDG
jgi:23S rRNA (guanosine2251-2'-O)-methyltransferase